MFKVSYRGIVDNETKVGILVLIRTTDGSGFSFDYGGGDIGVYMDNTPNDNGNNAVDCFCFYSPTSIFFCGKSMIAR
jgi:hypothetical protein